MAERVQYNLNVYDHRGSALSVTLQPSNHVYEVLINVSKTGKPGVFHAMFFGAGVFSESGKR
ncbi:hypothetical protein DUQ00_06310 [Salmonella bongori]|nr:hypothetical protein [Salmonella bongori]ECC9595954.1 hypothetical protein [Salmonella bongori]